MEAVRNETRVARRSGSRASSVRLAPKLLVAAAMSSLGAAVIHAAVAPSHLEALPPLGLLFIAAALGQAVWPALALTRPSARLIGLGLAGNLAILGGWAMSRTIGLPSGHRSWTPEPVTALDASATALELTVVAACLVLASSGAYRPPKRARLFAAISVLAVAALVVAAFVAGPSNSRSRPEDAPTPAVSQHAH